jgi:hypothetical protein
MFSEGETCHSEFVRVFPSEVVRVMSSLISVDDLAQITVAIFIRYERSISVHSRFS